MWCDTYDYAVRAEWLGVGIWGNRHAAPSWTGDEVARAVLTIISPGAEGERYRQRARELATPSRAQSGRVVAAREDRAGGREVSESKRDAGSRRPD